MELSGKIALITGVGRGIGRSCALALATEGAQIVVSPRTESEIEKVAAEIREMGGKAHALTLDVRQPESIEKAFKRTASEIGSVDILINNAGIARSEPLVKC